MGCPCQEVFISTLLICLFMPTIQQEAAGFFPPVFSIFSPILWQTTKPVLRCKCVFNNERAHALLL